MARASGSAGFFTLYFGNLLALPRHAANTNAPKGGAFMLAHFKRRWNATGGMATCIDALISTMDRPLGPRRILNAASIQSLNPGGSFQVPLSRLAALAPWQLARKISFAAARGAPPR